MEERKVKLITRNLIAFILFLIIGIYTFVKLSKPGGVIIGLLDILIGALDKDIRTNFFSLLEVIFKLFSDKEGHKIDQMAGRDAINAGRDVINIHQHISTGR